MSDDKQNSSDETDAAPGSAGGEQNGSGESGAGKDRPGASEQDAPKQLSDEELREALLQKGWVEATAMVEPGTVIPPKSKKETPARSADAERKVQEREELNRQGWRQLNVVAPDNPITREFLSAVARAVKSVKVLRTLRAAFADPELVMIGRRVRRLRGSVGDQVRKLIGL